MAKRRIGVLTSGGDCPGLNATIRGAVRTLNGTLGADNVEIVGIYDGFLGLIQDKCKVLTSSDLTGLLTLGGTFLGSKRTPFKKMEKIEEDGLDKIAAMKSTYAKHGLDAILALGGKGTHKNANLLSQHGINIVGLPKTIDNDIYGTDFTFGFHTAVEIGTEVLDRIHTTAFSHERVMVVEIMGNKAGWLALYAGLAGGADVILIPEIPYDIAKILQAIQARKDACKPYSMVVIAEGALTVGESKMKKSERAAMRQGNTATYSVVKAISDAGFESRAVVPGHMLRGGTPCAADRVLSTQYGARAAELICAEKYGYSVAVVGGKVTENRFADMAGIAKLVDANGDIVKVARGIGVSFGD
ncbi:MAG: ATP-dependent 6-phosphofructokinase [Oscillospiraceae bacterium]|nr:ATP-dependent 6-phosphofructokinase [Oscillospiraceae bacterium]